MEYFEVSGFGYWRFACCVLNQIKKNMGRKFWKLPEGATVSCQLSSFKLTTMVKNTNEGEYIW